MKIVILEILGVLDLDTDTIPIVLTSHPIFIVLVESFMDKKRSPLAKIFYM